MSYKLISIYLNREMYYVLEILLLADLHGGQNRLDRSGNILTHGTKAREIIKGVKQLVINLGISHAINIGDLGMCSKTHKEFQKLLNQMDCEWHNLIGNKELEYFDGDLEDVKKTLGYTTPYSFKLGGIDHILLDIETFSDHSIVIPETSLNFLRTHIKTANKHFIVYIHAPISGERGNIGFDDPLKVHRTFPENAKELRDIVDGTHCQGVISGHTHFYFQSGKHTTLPGVSQNSSGEADGRAGLLDTKTGRVKLEKVI